MSEKSMQELTEQQAASLPYYVHEGEMTRLERANKRWFIAFIIVLVMLFVTNAGWIVYDHQFETYQVQQDVDTGTGAAVVAGIGDVTYGQSEADNPGPSAEDQQPEPDEAVPEM